MTVPSTCPGASYALREMIDALGRVAAARGRRLGPISFAPDAEIEAIVATWPTHTEADRALALGLPADDGLERIIEDYIDDFLG